MGAALNPVRSASARSRGWVGEPCGERGLVVECKRLGRKAVKQIGLHAMGTDFDRNQRLYLAQNAKPAYVESAPVVNLSDSTRNESLQHLALDDFVDVKSSDFNTRREIEMRNYLKTKSGREDLNLRPPAPEPGSHELSTSYT